jgi:hypothetical protein
MIVLNSRDQIKSHKKIIVFKVSYRGQGPVPDLERRAIPDRDVSLERDVENASRGRMIHSHPSSKLWEHQSHKTWQYGCIATLMKQASFRGFL